MPTKGVMGSFNVTFSRGINSRPDDFIKYQGAIHFYHSLLEPVTLAVTGRAGYIDPKNDSIPVVDDQLFYLGGISSVRGYAENLLLRDDDDDPVGGRRSLSGSIEARMQVKKLLSLILFYDAGKLDRTYTPADTEIRSSVGLGLGYRTPVGPLSLYYGYKLNRQPDESPGRFHFSIGYTF
jgi:outer membrane protein insertion porin family